MVAAALTLWLMFALWLLAPLIGASRAVARIALWMLGGELFLLLMSSYGTAPLAQAMGVAARADVPALAVVFLLAVAARAVLAHGAHPPQRLSRPLPEPWSGSTRAEASPPPARTHPASQPERSPRRSW
jgi:hypothetical protein